MMHPALSFFGHAEDDAPRALAGPVDDLADKVSAKVEAAVDGFITQHTQHYATVAADAAYDRFRTRFEQDKDTLSTEIVSAAKPKVQKAVYDILDDAETQARLGAAKDEFKSTLTKALVVTAVGTAVATWALVTYVGKP